MGALSSLYVLHTQTSISFFICRMLVLYLASMFYILSPPFFSLSLASRCIILSPCSLDPTQSSLPGSRLYVHFSWLMFGLHSETSIWFFVCRMWVLYPSSMFYILKFAFFSLSLESRCFVLHPCSLYLTHPCPLLSSLYVHLTCLMLGPCSGSIGFLVSSQWVLCFHVHCIQPTLAGLSLACGCFVLLPCPTYSDLHTLPCL